MAAMIRGEIFSIAFFSKNRMIPQTTFVLTFRPHIIAELGGVDGHGTFHNAPRINILLRNIVFVCLFV